MKNEKIAVVIPVFNVERYLKRCLDSVIGQTYINIEIILINDGSTDSSGIICDEYARSDERIKIIHKKNGGLSDARNVGIKSSNSRLITFIDSDDWIELDFIENLYNAYVYSNSDIITTLPIKSLENKNGKLINIKSKIKNNKIISQKDKMFDAVFYRNAFGNSAWGKLYNIKLFSKIKYPVGCIFEDFATLYKMIPECNSIYATNINGYHYYQRNNSILHAEFSEKNLVYLNFANEMKDFISKYYPSNLKSMYSRYAEVNLELLIKLLESNSTDYRSYHDMFRHNIKKYSKFVLVNKYSRLYVKIRILLAIMGDDWLKIFRKILFVYNQYYLK